ncbi:MAG: hypothetical protein PQJ44_05325, partial [Sphaerochaetaceae bacterium]|nr:hypothetical protein [Sphaerochaetaceae bacterium]
LGDVLIVGEADLDSGSIRSVEFALKMQKDIYVLPHRLGESEGTNKLVQDGLAKTINNIDEFVSLFGTLKEDNCKDELLEFCKHSNKTYEEVLSKYADKLFEYELMGKLYVKDGLVLLK